MGKELLENEFFGEIARFCEDEKKIYFFDEITCGLFYMDKDTYNVGLLMSPDKFVSSGDFSVLRLIKFEDNIYIIPRNLKFGWRIFNLKSRSLDVRFPFDRDETIGNVMKIGSSLYIIPEQTNQAFAKFDIVTGMAKVLSNHWYDIVEPKECWGCSAYSDEIIFPIIGTNEIICFKDENIDRVRPALDEGIASVCLDNDGLWVLPELGDFIYNDDRKSGVSKIPIGSEGTTAGDYFRIISVGEYIILLPKTDDNVLLYKKKENRWICVEGSRGNRFRVLFRNIPNKNVPFWGYSFYAKKLRFMPQRYRLAEMDLETGKMNFRKMNCGEGFTGEQYKKWAKRKAHTGQNGEEQILRETVFGYLQDFMEYI